jgi:hypothetical protein
MERIAFNNVSSERAGIESRSLRVIARVSGGELSGLLLPLSGDLRLRCL